MNGKAHEDDIGIGPDRWIECGGLAGGHGHAVDAIRSARAAPHD
ncbi:MULTISPECIES: hypothetical protein [unclassified Burkholderia]|nr:MULTISPECIES: hypothetical protein [unclassified Burkholderia]